MKWYVMVKIGSKWHLCTYSQYKEKAQKELKYYKQRYSTREVRLVQAENANNAKKRLKNG